MLNLSEELRKNLLEKSAQVDFEEMKDFKAREELIRGMQDQIIAQIPTSGADLVHTLADGYTAQIVGVSEEFFIAGFRECLRMLSAGLES